MTLGADQISDPFRMLIAVAMAKNLIIIIVLLIVLIVSLARVSSHLFTCRGTMIERCILVFTTFDVGG